MLDGKVCVVTGALGLISSELVRVLLAAGGKVVVTDLDHGACVDRAHALGERALGRGADITQPASLAALLAAIALAVRRAGSRASSARISTSVKCRVGDHSASYTPRITT
jgi:NAD(P)-dependent dehydrogenase (short-subunit alcohol dehydrogenase family)